MEEIFNWAMLGWLLNVGMFILVVVVLTVKVMTREDTTLFKINVEIFKQRIKPISNYQRWASYIIPYYEVLQGIILLAYFIKNYNRDTIIVLIEIDYILVDYRIWKRNGLAN